MDAAATKRQMLVEVAAKYEGVMETGENGGPMVETFQKAVDGKANGESWCAGFAFFCIHEVDRLFEEKFGGVNPPSPLFNSEHVMTIWNKSNPKFRHNSPEIGDLMVWQKMVGLKGTGQGHIEIVVKIIDDHTVETIGGNTSPGPGVNREGEGVFRKQRRFTGAATTKLVRGPMMKVMGFLSVWG